MAERDYLEEFLEQRRTLSPPGRDPAARAQRRQHMVRALRGHLGVAHRRRLRSRIWRRVGLGTLSVAIAACGLLAFLRLEPTRATGIGVDIIGGGIVLQRPGGGRGLVPGEAVVVGLQDSLETRPDQGGELRFPDVVTVSLSPDASVSGIEAQDGRVDRIRLTRGRAHLSVRKLEGGHRFHVITDDAEIQVRGTEFDVDLGRGPSPHTCVRVQEGLVVIVARQAQESLGAGQSWGCDPPTAATASRTAPAPAKKPTRISASDLRAQNGLLQRALAAERSGSTALAAELYRRLLARYPDGPLTAQARANLAAMRASP